MTVDFLTLLLVWAFAALENATPLIFVTLGETLTQRTGVINLGVEGEMLFGACFGFGVAAATGNPWLGLLAGIAAGAGLSLVHAFVVLVAHANQIACGIAVWLVGLGVTSYVGRAFVGGEVRRLPWPSPDRLDRIPLIGPALAEIGLPALFALVATALAAWWLARTRTGLAWRAAGESAEIALENGLSPIRSRFLAILTGGAFAGLGGAILSINYTQTWAQDITKGQGLIAVGLVIVARWQPALVLPVCMVFGLAETAALRLPAAGIEVSSYFLSSLPYLAVLAVIVLSHVLSPVRAAMPMDLRAVFR